MVTPGLTPAVTVSLMPMLQATNFIMRPPPRMAKRPGICHYLAFTHTFFTNFGPYLCPMTHMHQK